MRTTLTRGFAAACLLVGSLAASAAAGTTDEPDVTLASAVSDVDTRDGGVHGSNSRPEDVDYGAAEVSPVALATSRETDVNLDEDAVRLAVATVGPQAAPSVAPSVLEATHATPLPGEDGLTVGDLDGGDAKAVAPQTSPEDDEAADESQSQEPEPQEPEPQEPEPQEPEPEPEPQEPAAEVFTTADGQDIDADRIRAFLDRRGSPLRDHAETFVEAGVAHDVDPRVVVAISVAESSAGEALPPGTYNAWGWSGAGPQGLASWNSWSESIHHYTERLGALYDTDNVNKDFAQTYCPPNWRWWLDTVTGVIDEI